MILDHLILRDAHTRFLDGELRQSNARLVRGNRRGEKDFVHLFLRIGGEFFLRRTYFFQHFAQRLFVVHDKIFHKTPPLCR